MMMNASMNNKKLRLMRIASACAVAVSSIAVATVMARGGMQPAINQAAQPAAAAPSPAVAPIAVAPAAIAPTAAIAGPDWAKLQVTHETLAELAPGPALLSALNKATDFVTSAPTLQRITLTHRTVIGGQASDVQSQVLLHVRPATSHATNVGPAFRLDVANLIVSLVPQGNGHRLVAVNTLNTELYWQREIPAGKNAWKTIESFLPPLALPTLSWAMQAEAERKQWAEQLQAEQLAATGGRLTTSMPLVGSTTWLGVTRDGGLLVGDNCILRMDKTTGQPLALQFDLSANPSIVDGPLAALAQPANSPSDRGPWLFVQIEFLVAPRADEAAVAAWEPSLSERTKVAQLTELVAKPTEIAAGEQVPVLALLDGTLRGWAGLEEMLDAAAKEAAAGSANRERSCILVLFNPTDAKATKQAREAALAAEAVQRTFELRYLAGKPLAPRVFAVSAAVMELEQMKADRVKQIVQEWQHSGAAKKDGAQAGERAPSPSPTPIASPIVFSSGGEQLLSRFAPRSNAVVLVIASDGTLVRALPLDERAVEREALARELLTLVPDRANVK